MLPLGRVTWAICSPCQWPWPVGEDLFDVPDDIDEMMYDYFFGLVADAFAAAGDLQRKGRSDMMTTKRDSAFLVDPWVGAESANSNPDLPHEPPLGWRALTLPTRERIAAVLLEREVSVDGAGLGPWRRLVARYTKAAEMGENAALTAALAAFWDPDSEAREAWRKAAAELQREHQVMMLGIAERKLVKGGDVLTMLRARRDALDQQIAALEGRALVR